MFLSCKCPVRFQIREVDNNFDGKPDELIFKLRANVPKGTDVLMVNLILTIDYKLRVCVLKQLSFYLLKRDFQRCPFEMQSAIVLQEPVTPLLHSVNVMSVLQIMQLRQLTCYFKHQNVCYNKSILQDEHEFDRHKFQDTIAEYMKRNSK